MENLTNKNHSDKQLGFGVLIIVIGAVLLLRNSGIDVPHWVLSWHTIMLGAGLWIGYRKNFQGSGWLAFTLIGGFFTLRDITFFDFEMSKISIALVLIGLGLWVILKPKQYKPLNNFQNSAEQQNFKN